MSPNGSDSFSIGNVEVTQCIIEKLTALESSSLYTRVKRSNPKLSLAFFMTWALPSINFTVI